MKLAVFVFSNHIEVLDKKTGECVVWYAGTSVEAERDAMETVACYGR